MADRTEPEVPRGPSSIPEIFAPMLDVHAPDQTVAGSTDVFISYASQDGAVAHAVLAALERYGIRCWIAPRDVRPGALYADEIIRAINGSKILVVVLSASSVASPHVGKEVERASSKQRSIFTFRVDTSPLTTALEYFLSESQWIDVGVDGTEAAFARLTSAVQRQLASASVAGTAQPMPNPRRHPRAGARAGRRWVWSTAAIVAVLVAGALLVVVKLRLSKDETQRAPILPVASMALPAAPAIPQKSVAVLPFVDMSEKHDQEYFSDGLSEELIDMLTKISDLRVPARTSSFYFKGKQAKISDIAKELGVANVLEGSVRKAGNQLRITAQLIRADSGYHLWSETYDRQIDDIFKVQDDISRAVVTALKVSLLDADAPSATLTSSREAYELYLQARSLLHSGTSDDTLKAYADLQSAVRLDPKFASAWAILSAILSSDSVDWTRVFKSSDSPSRPAELERDVGASWSTTDIDRDWGRSWAQARAAARAAAEQAVITGPDLGISHAAMGLVLSSVDRNWAAADVELKRARELDPGRAGISLAAARLATRLGRLSEGLELANRAYAQDPLGDAIGFLGHIQYISGDLDAAQVSIRREIELYPTQTGVHSQYAFVLLARGDPKAALSEFERESAPQFRDVGLSFALDALGRHREADSAIALAEQKWADGMAWNIACFYGYRNNSDLAFQWLERAYRQHDGGMSELKIEPTLKTLRHDPRYQALLREMNLPQ
jgi:TolB-like protein/tetratricopeptide (TPR) repeat protein